MRRAAPRAYSVYVPVEWMNNRAADFNRDGAADYAVWRPSNGVWYVAGSRSDSFSAVQFGQSGDTAIRSGTIPE